MNDSKLPPKNSHVLHIMTDETLLLSEQVAKHAGLTLKEAQALIKMGAIYLEKLRVTEDREVKVGAYLRLHSRPRRYPVADIHWKACIFHETEDFIIVNKPPGFPVPSTVDNLFENVAHQVSTLLSVPIYVTQRLDRPTSGLLVLAKSKKFQRDFNQLLFKRLVEKKYVALTEKKVPLGLYSHYIEDSKSVPKRVVETPMESFVTADLRVVKSDLVKSTSWYESEVELLTGRTHQIRAQFAHLGYPLLGDIPYGGNEAGGFHENKIGLKAVELKFLNFSFKVSTFSDEMADS